VHLHDAEPDAGIGLDFLLQVLGELLIAFRGYDGQRIDRRSRAIARPSDSRTRRKPRPMVWRRSRSVCHLAQGANLEHVRIIPTLAQRGVGEDEFQRRIEANNFSLSRMIRL
jgi:hypothetical protein